MRSTHSSRHRLLGLLLLAASPATALAQLLDFGQLDVSDETQTLVLVKALKDANPRTPDPLITAAFTNFSTGSTGSVGYMHRWAVTGGPHVFAVGAGVGANRFRSDNGGGDDSGLSARGQAEISGPVLGGSYYGLLQVSTFRRASLALVQYNPGNTRLGVEVSRYTERGYGHTSAALRYAFDESRRWHFRFGALRANGETNPFIGLAYNGF